MPAIPRILIAAAAKSSGKTTLTVGLARALKDRGLTVRAFKKGPDYIDPLWHRLAAGRAGYNLDFNTQSPDEILRLLALKGSGADINIIETNKGLHDGIDLKGRDSNAALARLTQSPVVLLIDTEGTTRGIAPLLLGYQAFDPAVSIAGVILNRVGGPRHEEKLRAAVETYTDIPVLGAVPRDPAMVLPERHLGLTTPGDMEAELSAHVDRIAQAVRGGVDLDRLLRIAATAPALEMALPPAPPPPAPDVRVAIAQDAAFCFTYADDLEAFAAAGAELAPFSPIADERLPENIDGLFLPGGFPETHMAELAANESMR
ncbi:MAG TPA: cobyrinate a,c-diamide synthase, partial [Thermopetrobacter sp.]|nr:cobyrinate a,c-diamide synthase [Thermopetrobacter sp.]